MIKIKKVFRFYRVIGALIDIIMCVLVKKKFQFIELDFKYSLELNFIIYIIIVLSVGYYTMYADKYFKDDHEG